MTAVNRSAIHHKESTIDNVTLNHAKSAPPEISCDNCEACCCRLKVMLFTDTGVPDRFIESDDWGALSMRQLDDGWCAALDRNSLRCSIYQQRPLICREFEMGAEECLTERAEIIIRG
ncbi:MAG: YkgJ family cysteine cluster protein [Motiliproteus sp.]